MNPLQITLHLGGVGGIVISFSEPIQNARRYLDTPQCTPNIFDRLIILNYCYGLVDIINAMLYIESRLGKM
jgi:hypothetical protein